MAVKPKSLNVELPAGLEPIYSNFALISHSPSEIILDLAQMLPNQPQVRVKARVVVTVECETPLASFAGQPREI